MAKVFLGLGANEGDTVGNVIMAIGAILETDGVSPLGAGSYYETEPVGNEDQEWFLNTAIAISTTLPPEKLLDRIKEIETAMGRKETGRWGPREIDIDILFYDDLVMDTDRLTIPHKESAKRRFVLQPVSDIDPTLLHPVEGKTVSELLKELPENGQSMRLAG